VPGRLTEAQPPSRPQSRETRESPTASADEPGRWPNPPGRRRFSPGETLAVLIDLDRLVLELRRPPSSSVAPPGLANPKPAPTASSPTRVSHGLAAPSDGRPSPYLDERLASARRASTALAVELHQMEAKSKGLRESIDTIDRELARADEELALLRSTEWRAATPKEPEPPTAGRPPSPPTSSTIGETKSPTARGSGELPPSHVEARAYHAFTVGRYNDTVGELQGRWSRTARLVLLAAVAISVSLELLLLLSREPLPAWWIAVLPAVWMIPVPFFVVSFRATHRLVRQVRFGLPAAP
jgi:hypothetical protein